MKIERQLERNKIISKQKRKNNTLIYNINKIELSIILWIHSFYLSWLLQMETAGSLYQSNTWCILVTAFFLLYYKFIILACVTISVCKKKKKKKKNLINKTFFCNKKKLNYYIKTVTLYVIKKMKHYFIYFFSG